MLREELIFVGTCDIAGHVRGKAFPARELDARRRKGIGWTHSNLMQTAFGPIFDTPFGTAGDLMIVPDPHAEVRVDFADGSAPEHFFLGDIRNTDGRPWECCPREFLRRAHRRAGGRPPALRLIAAFEQEFVYTGIEDRPGDAYSLGAFRRQGGVRRNLRRGPARRRRHAGLVPAGIRRPPVRGHRGARARADRRRPCGDHPRDGARDGAPVRPSRGVLADAGGGWRRQRRAHPSEPARCRRPPVTHDPAGPFGLSHAAQQFCAGVLHHLPAIAAITAPSPVSYLRLTPNRWAPTAIDIVQQDRGAALRVCPVFAAADADGDRAAVQRRVPRLRCRGQPLHGAGRGAVRRRRRAARAAWRCRPPAPARRRCRARSRPALNAMEASEAVQAWFGPVFLDAYLRHKRSELAYVAQLAAPELCQRYAEVY